MGKTWRMALRPLRQELGRVEAK
ncbi:protein of unknown function [Candidatus Hydrogenisulfobacillus filiaventi]|uniref:Uncharacterized protein n=1 Tax=Candidatus Hydrogenisulfobacillus filiaventi TaxID=2707344 RepID=A0A6F8ZDP0_9FIRM|nr:protein of unknown function [Candidatus Hydrogenisulfobacillus filiaventi]